MSTEDRLDRAEKSFDDGDIRAAIIGAKDVLLDEPDNLRGRLLLGRFSVASGDGASAEKELKRAIELGAERQAVAADLALALLMQGKFSAVLEEVPLEDAVSPDDEVVILVAHGDAYMGLDEPETARDMYVTALERNPEYLAAQLGIASSYVAERNFIQAQSAIGHLLETNPEVPRVWLYSGGFNARTGDFETAEANFRVALELANAQNNDAARLEALSGLSSTLFELGESDEAREYVEVLSAEAPQSIETRLLIARVAFIDKDWKTVQQSLQQVLAEVPDFRPAQVMLGSAHLESGNLQQAEMYLSSAVAALPDDVAARQLLAATQLQMEKVDEAQASLAPIVERSDADPVSLQMAARASMSLRNIDEALKYLRRSVDENPGNVDLQFQLAATLIEAGRGDEAQSMLDSIDVSGSSEAEYRRDALAVLNAVRLGHAVEAQQAAERLASEHADKHGAFNLLGAIHLANQDVESAKESFERASTLAPTDLTSQRYLAIIDASQGNLEPAAARLRKVLADQPNTAWASFALGQIAFMQEDFESAETHFRQALEVEPQNSDYRLALARAKHRRGENAGASETLESDLEATLDHIPSAVALGSIKAKEGDVEGALEIAKQLQGRHPNNPVPVAFEAEVHLSAGDLAKADMAYDKALDLGLERNHVLRSYQVKQRLGVAGADGPLLRYLEQRPLDNAMRAVLAEAYLQAEDFSKSIANYERVVTDEPQNAVALNNLAWSYYLVDDPRAVDTARKALDAMPDNGAIVDTLGWILVEQGQVGEGEKILRQAVELTDGRAEVRYHHAVSLSKLGRTEEARAALADILAGEETFASRKEAEQLLAEL